MKIIYNQNPLRTVVELDEHEKKELWYKVKIEQMEWAIHGAHFHLDPNYQFYDLDKARADVNPEKLKTMDTYVDTLHQEYLDAIVDIHCGDCTCVPASCFKCQGESLLGLDTIPGLGKHEASYVWSAFDMKPGGVDGRDIHQAVEYLEQCKPHADWQGWEAHAERWAREIKGATEWLTAYRDSHFSR